MRQIRVATSALIAARPQDVYSVVADYHHGHPHILPKIFRALQVEQGGVGAGTIINVRTRVWGVETSQRMLISEPEPGRVLVETDLTAKSTMVTTFTFTPENDGLSTLLEISTTLDGPDGLAGFLSQLVYSFALRGPYRQELRQVSQVVKDRAASATHVAG